MKILIITKNLLDLSDAQSQQSFALILALQEMFDRVDIVCGYTVEAELRFVKGALLPSSHIHALHADWVIGGGSLINKIHRKLKRNLLSVIPSRWVREASKLSNGLNEIHDYSIVLSVGLPMESNMVGLNLLRKKKWVAAFSDPWPESIMPRPYSDFNISFLSMLQRRVVEDVLNNSRIAVFTCSQSMDFFKQHYRFDSRKGVVITHIAPEKISTRKKIGDDLLITYAGSLSRERCSSELFLAIADLQENSRIKFQFVGYVHSSAHELINKLNLNLSGKVVLHGPLSKEKTFDLIERSDVLLSIEAKMDCYPFLPSKIADYSAFGLPIIAITGESSATAEILSFSEGSYACGHDRHSILTVLNQIEIKKSGKLNYSVHEFFEKKHAQNSYIDIARKLSDFA